MSEDEKQAEPIGRETMPFVAPCRELRPFAPLGWLRLGFRDLSQAPQPSLLYGFFIMLMPARMLTATM